MYIYELVWLNCHDFSTLSASQHYTSKMRVEVRSYIHVVPLKGAIQFYVSIGKWIDVHCTYTGRGR